MSNNHDNLDSKLSDAKATAERLLTKRNRTTQAEVADPMSLKDWILWIIAAVLLTSIMFVNSKLPGYWAPANDIWVRLGIISLFLVVSIICIALTKQGVAFKQLLKDAATELRRVTWPSKKETIHWTWITSIAIIIFGLVVWLLDSIFNQVMTFIIG